MKIYVGHSTNSEYREDLYKPLRRVLGSEHDFVFPHEKTEELFDSKNFLKNEADLMIAEVSNPSTGLGIELGWAEEFSVEIICIFSNKSKPISALEALDGQKVEYRNEEDMVKKLSLRLEN